MPSIGDYVCVRSREQGVVFGTLTYRAGRECGLSGARQQHNWRGKALTLFDVLVQGPKKTKLKLSAVLGEIDMTEICGVLLVPHDMIEEFKSWPAAEV